MLFEEYDAVQYLRGGGEGLYFPIQIEFVFMLCTACKLGQQITAINSELSNLPDPDTFN